MSNKTNDLNKSSLKDIVQEHTESFSEVTHQAEEKIKSAVLDTASSLKTEAKTFIGVVQDQVKQFQDDVHEQVDSIKEKLSNSKETLFELKDNLLNEFKHSVNELTQLGQEIKGEVSAISNKSKEHLVESYQRIKGNTAEAVNQTKADDKA